MEKIMLWGLLALGFILLVLILRKLPIKDGLIIFLFTSYISVIAGTIAVEEGMLDYPVKLFKRQHFHSSILFEMLLLPVVCLYFYRTTSHSTIFHIVIQSAVYSTALTVVEYLLERHTALIEYHTWTPLYTLISVFLLLILVRGFIGLIKKRS